MSTQVYGKEIFPIYDKTALESVRQEQTWKYFYLPEVKVEYEFEYHADGGFKQLTIYDP